jgi:hypothetical protein
LSLKTLPLLLLLWPSWRLRRKPNTCALKFQSIWKGETRVTKPLF